MENDQINVCMTSPRSLNIDQRAGILTTVGSGMHFGLWIRQIAKKVGLIMHCAGHSISQVPAQLWRPMLEEDISAQ